MPPYPLIYRKFNTRIINIIVFCTKSSNIVSNVKNISRSVFINNGLVAIRDDIDDNIPVLINARNGSQVWALGHTFIIDGYWYSESVCSSASLAAYHVNWGWGGLDNGWFAVGDFCVTSGNCWYYAGNSITEIEP